MTFAAATRIQSATAKKSGGEISANSFAARVQSAAAKNQNVSPAKLKNQ